MKCPHSADYYDSTGKLWGTACPNEAVVQRWIYRDETSGTFEGKPWPPSFSWMCREHEKQFKERGFLREGKVDRT